MDEKTESAIDVVLENWEQLGVEEHDGILHLPATIKRRQKDGTLKELKVCLRPITNRQRYRCRVQSRHLAKKLDLDGERDTDLINELENYAILAYAIRDPKTFDQHVPNAEELLEHYDPKTLEEVWGRLDNWVEILDPRYGEYDNEKLWEVIAEISQRANITPLAGMPGYAQATLIMLMASEACYSPNAPSWLQSSATSTPAS